MKNHITILLMPLLVIASCKSPGGASVHTTGDAGGYRLVWADEFNKDGRPDTANCKYEHGVVSYML